MFVADNFLYGTAIQNATIMNGKVQNILDYR